MHARPRPWRRRQPVDPPQCTHRRHGAVKSVIGEQHRQCRRSCAAPHPSTHRVRPLHQHAQEGRQRPKACLSLVQPVRPSQMSRRHCEACGLNRVRSVCPPRAWKSPREPRDPQHRLSVASAASCHHHHSATPAPGHRHHCVMVTLEAFARQPPHPQRAAPTHRRTRSPVPECRNARAS